MLGVSLAYFGEFDLFYLIRSSRCSFLSDELVDMLRETCTNIPRVVSTGYVGSPYCLFVGKFSGYISGFARGGDV